MTHTIDDRLGRGQSVALAVFRIVIGFLFALHGTAKLFGWPVTKSGAAEFGSWPYWWAGVIELGVGVLVIVGLFTRIAALLGSGTMAYAYFTVHQPQALLPINNGGELAAVYCFAFLLLAVTGPGSLALRRRPAREHAGASTASAPGA